ncbi:hypothetical protein FB451DRAFT_1179599 [Mycena latifolia]|nr:hypothetical protein FB451DRAFT_1179599 [Mycena latifolia]
MARPASPAPSLSCPHCLIPLHSSNAPEPPDIPNDLLATNRPPLDPEIPCIQRVIAAKQARKMRLDAQIAAVEKSLKKLIEDRCVLEEEIKKHEGTLSPLRRMPPELLSLVFIFARPSDRDPAPWIFSQVCRYWRATAIFQPTFWASVVLDFGWESYRTTTEFRLETHLQRSGNLPLNISFKCRFSDECTEQELGVMKVIANHCARWEKILISAPPSLFSDLACVRGHLPILRSLNLSHSFGVRADEEDSTDVFELAPSLQDAFVNMGRGAVTVMLPFSQLHRYYARGTWDSDLNALRSTSNLVECALHIDDISTPPSTAIALPHLLKLSLSHSELLECLDTPNLQELYCSSQSNHLSSLFARRPYQLRKLVLFYPASITDFAGVLRAVPTITDIDSWLPAFRFRQSGFACGYGGITLARWTSPFHHCARRRSWRAPE